MNSCSRNLNQSLKSVLSILQTRHLLYDISNDYDLQWLLRIMAAVDALSVYIFLLDHFGLLLMKTL